MLDTFKYGEIDYFDGDFEFRQVYSYRGWLPPDDSHDAFHIELLLYGGGPAGGLLMDAGYDVWAWHQDCGEDRQCTRLDEAVILVREDKACCAGIRVAITCSARRLAAEYKTGAMDLMDYIGPAPYTQKGEAVKADEGKA